MASDAQTALQILEKNELFQGLPTGTLEAAAGAARLRRLPKEAHVFNQGGEEVRAHAIIEGAVRIAQFGSDGAQILIRFVGPGETFGAVALFTDRRYPADAITLSETLEASWSEAELFELMNKCPEIAINLVRIVGRRLQEAQERIRELATQRADQRVAHAVLRLARQTRQTEGEAAAVAFPLRRKDIADISGTTLHTASRILTAWEKAGLVVTRKQRLIIRRLSEIQRIAEHDAD